MFTMVPVILMVCSGVDFHGWETTTTVSHSINNNNTKPEANAYNLNSPEDRKMNTLHLREAAWFLEVESVQKAFRL